MFFPIGLAYVIGSLKAHSVHKVDVLDLNINHYARENFKTYVEKRFQSETLPDFFLIGAISTAYQLVSALVKDLKSSFPNIPVIVGGTLASIHSQLLLERLKVDVAVLGEAEETIIELFEKWENLESCKGIAFLKNGEYYQTLKRDRQKNLDAIPMPSYESFQIEDYIQSFKKFFGLRGLQIITTRGCPYNCKFCYRNFGNKVYYRSPAHVVKEIKYLADTYNIEGITFYDEFFFADKKWMGVFADELLKSKVKIKWSCTTRVNLITEKDYELLLRLKKTGLVRICFGIESASQKILDNIGKIYVTPSKIRNALRIVRRAGLKATGNFIIGSPGETPDTIAETVNFCKENLLKTTFYVLQPFPGTAFYKELLSDKYTEIEYLERLKGRTDASQLQFNLTDMTNEEFLELKEKAEREINKFYLLRYLKYYGAIELPRQIFLDVSREMRRRIQDSFYQTI